MFSHLRSLHAQTPAHGRAEPIADRPRLSASAVLVREPAASGRREGLHAASPQTAGLRCWPFGRAFALKVTDLSRSRRAIAFVEAALIPSRPEFESPGNDRPRGLGPSSMVATREAC
jgi:hypothetical protein